MSTMINAKELRRRLPQVVEGVRKGARLTVVYRSRPALQIVPVHEHGMEDTALEDDSLYQAIAVGRSTDKLTTADHDAVLYGK